MPFCATVNIKPMKINALLEKSPAIGRIMPFSAKEN
jgi:hypothetical protein